MERNLCGFFAFGSVFPIYITSSIGAVDKMSVVELDVDIDSR